MSLLCFCEVGKHAVEFEHVVVGEDHWAEHADRRNSLYDYSKPLNFGQLLPIEDFGIEKDGENLPDDNKGDHFCDSWQSSITRILLFSKSVMKQREVVFTYWAVLMQMISDRSATSSTIKIKKNPNDCRWLGMDRPMTKREFLSS